MGIRLGKPFSLMRLGNSDGGASGGYPIYGVSWGKVASPVLTRTDDAVGMVAAAGVDSTPVTNDFDNADIYSEITEVTDAYGNVFVRIPRFFIRKTDGVGYKTWQVSKSPHGTGWYLPWCFWDFTNNRSLAYVDVGKYPGYINAGKLESKAGTYPTINTNIVDFRTAAKANGAGYQQLDVHVVDVLQTLSYIEFATLNIQPVMAGYTAGRYNAADLMTADTTPAANTLAVSNATGALYEVGQAISVGTTLGGNQRFYGRTITAIDVDTPGAGTTTITFDGVAVETFTGDILYNTGYRNVDGVTATSGSAVSNSSGKHYCKYREIVSPYGNMWQFVDGLNISDRQAWVCRDASSYASNLFASPYTQLGYANHNADGYVTAVGYDEDNPFAALPTAAGGNSLTYFSDYYTQNSGQRIALFCGGWYAGSPAGLSCWYMDFSSSGTGLALGARLCRKGG